MIVCETQSIIIDHTITLHVQQATLGPYGGNIGHKRKENEKIQKKNEHKCCACKCYRLQSYVFILCMQLILEKRGAIFTLLNTDEKK